MTIEGQHAAVPVISRSRLEMLVDGEDRKVHRQRFVTVWKKVNGEWKVATTSPST